MHTLERFLEWGGTKKDVTCLVMDRNYLMRHPYSLGSLYRSGDRL